MLDATNNITGHETMLAKHLLVVLGINVDLIPTVFCGT